MDSTMATRAPMLCSGIQPLCSLRIGLSHCRMDTQFSSWQGGTGSPVGISPSGATPPPYEPEPVHLSLRPITSARAALWPRVGPGTHLCHPALPLLPGPQLARETGGPGTLLEATSPAALTPQTLLSAQDPRPGTRCGTVLSPGKIRAQ